MKHEDIILPGLVVLMLIVAMFLIPRGALGQELHTGHPAKDMEIHKQFYSNWMQPNNRAVSCCHDDDCAPAEAHKINGKWWARKDNEPDKEFTEIPEGRIELERDNPDGRNHLCGRRYHFNGGEGLTVFCFITGGGI